MNQFEKGSVTIDLTDEMMIVEETDEELTTVIAVKVVEIKRSTRENERGTTTSP